MQDVGFAGRYRRIQDLLPSTASYIANRIYGRQKFMQPVKSWTT